MVCGNEPALFTQLIDCYLQESPPLLAAMRDAMLQEKAEEFARAAHSLKSSSQYFGARKVVELCRTLEQFGRSGKIQDTEEIAVMMDQLEAQYSRVEVALQQERDAV
jgi:HPt (histidine-containing phosphotransfer) domain-containing protein